MFSQEDITRGDVIKMSKHRHEITWMVLDAVSKHVSIDSVKYLYYAGFPIDDIFNTICRGQLCDVMDWMFSAGIPLPEDILSTICVTGNIHMFNSLIQHGATLNIVPNEGNYHENYHSPLFVAVRYDRIDMIHQLYIHGANMSLRDNEGQNALHYAFTLNNYKMIKTLLDLGVPIVSDNEGNTPDSFTDDPEIKSLLN